MNMTIPTRIAQDHPRLYREDHQVACLAVTQYPIHLVFEVVVAVIVIRMRNH